MSIVLNCKNFDAEVLNYDGNAVVDFWAEWCGPCRMLGPVIESLGEKYEGKIKFCKLNVDDCQDLALKYGVTSIPCVVFFKKGQVVGKSVGYKPQAQLEEAVVDALLK